MAPSVSRLSTLHLFADFQALTVPVQGTGTAVRPGYFKSFPCL